jgi:hypothetical protein
MGQPAWAVLGPVSAATLHLFHFGSFAPSIVDYGRRCPSDQVEGSLCMNFRSIHLGPQEFSIEPHWSLPPLEESLHTVKAS